MFRRLICCITLTLSAPCLLAAGETEDAFNRLDKDGSGYVTPSEVDATRQSLFERMLRVSDADKDGKISLSEYASSLKPSKPSAAATGPVSQRSRNPADAQRMLAALFTRFDADKNGSISRKEAPDRLKQRFAMLDANRDGEISRQEISSRARESAQPGNSRSSRFQQLDKNGDKQISRSEAQGMMKQRFNQIDEDNDGQLSGSELRAAFEKFRSQQGAMRRRPQ